MVDLRFSTSRHLGLSYARVLRSGWRVFAAFSLATLLTAGFGGGARAEVQLPSKDKPLTKKGDFRPEDPTVEFFAAIESGQIAVRFIPQNAQRGRVFIENRTDAPLNVQLPDAFAGVLAQFGPGGFPGFPGANNDNNNNGANQRVGGGFPNNNNNPINFFNVPPDRVGDLEVKLVCLEYGKKEPRPQVAYEIKPLDAVSSDPVLHELLSRYAREDVSQREVQICAWHLSDGMSFDRLAKLKIRRLAGPASPYFTRSEISGAKKLLEKTQQRLQRGDGQSVADTSSSSRE